MSTPLPSAPRARLTAAIAEPRPVVTVAAIERPEGWEIAAAGPTSSVVIAGVPSSQLVGASRIAWEAVEPGVPSSTYAPASHRPPAAALHLTITSDRDPVVAGVQQALEIERPPRHAVPKPLVRLDVACDASRGVGPQRGFGGYAAVTADGRWVARATRSNVGIDSLELLAIMAALQEFGGEPLAITSDSQHAVAIANGEQSVGSSSSYSERAVLVRQLVRAGNHTVTWVRGHNGDHLNEIADRLATNVRRSGAGGHTHRSDVREMFSRIAADALLAPADAPVERAGAAA